MAGGRDCVVSQPWAEVRDGLGNTRKWPETPQVTSCVGLKTSLAPKAGGLIAARHPSYHSQPENKLGALASKSISRIWLLGVGECGEEGKLGVFPGSLSQRMEAWDGGLWKQQKWTCEELLDIQK